MREFFLSITACFGLAGVAHATPVQAVYTAPAQVGIPGGDGNTSAIVQNVTLTLTRDVTTSNRETTYWKLNYHYYNGAYRWEDYQEMYIDFVDQFGVTLLSHGVVVPTPSHDCHYNGGIDITKNGTMDFDFRGKQLTIKVSGSTPTPSEPNQNHKC